MSMPGHLGRVLGSSDAQQLEVVLGDGIGHAYRRVWANAARKEKVGNRSLSHPCSPTPTK
jgi:hypothetical protein